MTVQNELQEPSSHNVRFLSDDTLLIDNLKVTDSQVIELVRQKFDAGEDLEHLIEELLSIGAKAASVFSSNAGAETIKNAVEAANQGIDKSLSSVTETIKTEIKSITSEDGTLHSNIATVMKDFAREVEKSIAGEDAPVRKAISASLDSMLKGLNENVDKSLKSHNEEIEKLLDPENATSPLRGLRSQLDAITQIVRDLQKSEEIDAAEDAIKHNAPIGGVEYEKLAVDSLILVVNELGDTCESTGATEGFVKRSKKGDAVAEFNTSIGQKIRIAVEAKDSALSIKEWRKEMAGSKENRRAEGFIGLCKSPALMPNVGQRVWIDDMKSVVIAFDPEVDDTELLKSIYQFVKLTSMTRSGQLEENKAAKLLDHINASISIIAKFDEANRNLTGLETSTKSLRTILGDIRRVLDLELVEAQKTINGFDPNIDSLDHENIESDSVELEDEIL